MNDEERELLKRVAKQVEQNNDILKGMRSAERWNKFFKLLYWVVIILIGLYTWSLMQPVIDSLMQALGEIGKAKDSLGDSISGLQDSLKGITDLTNKVKDLGI